MKQDMKKFAKNIERWSRAFPSIIDKANKKMGPIFISDIRTKSLSGQVLNKRSGKLQRSIHTVFKKGSMKIGTDVTSKGGFGYGAYWFGKGRDFLNPAIDKNMDKIADEYGVGIENAFVRMVK